MKNVIISLLLMLCSVAHSNGQGRYSIYNATEQCMDVSGFMTFLPDFAQKLTFSDISSDSLATKFLEFNTFKPIQVADTKDGKPLVFWGKLSIKNHTNQPGNYYFETAGFDSVTIYWINSRKQLNVYHDGDKKHSVSDTIMSLIYFGRPHIYILPGEEATVYIRYVRPSEKRWFTFNLLLMDAQQYADGVTKSFVIHSFFLAILLLTLLYTSFLYYSFKEKAYLWFCIMEAGFVFLVLDWSGLGTAFIGKHQVWSMVSKQVEVLFVIPAIQVGTYLFASSFINFGSYFPRLHKLFIGIISAALLAMVVVYIAMGRNKLFDNIEENVYLIWGILVVGLFSIAVIKRIPYATVLFITLLLLQLPLIIPLLFGELPEIYWLESSISAQIILWLGIVSYKIGKLRKEFVRSTSDLVESLKENEALVRKQNEELEQKVKERTAELKAANETLTDTIQYLKETQLQLIETEKQKEKEILRTRISQDIHDDISSELTKISWMSELANLKALKSDMQNASILLGKIISSSRETIGKLGEIIWAVSPQNDTLESLLSFMRDHISKFLSDTGFAYSINFPESQPGVMINPELKRNLFMVMKETLNNAVKYSQADRIDVMFRLEGDRYLLSIKDNGIGLHSMKAQGTGYGLKNMAERMEHVKGTLTIHSPNESGTEIIFEGTLY